MISGSQIGKKPTPRRDPTIPITLETWIFDMLNTQARQGRPPPYVISLREAGRNFPEENLKRSALEPQIAKYRQHEWQIRWRHEATGMTLLFTPVVKANVLHHRS